MMRLYHWTRITGVAVLASSLASCSQGPVFSPSATAHLTTQQRQFNPDGTIPACRTEWVAFTTQVHVIGSAHTTAVDITSTLIDRGKFACALPQPVSACSSDPTAEVTTTDGHLVWSPDYQPIPCPARPPGTPPVLIYPGQPLDTSQAWNLTTCRPNNGCLAEPVAAGKYVARGTSDTVGKAQGAAFTVR